MNFMNREYSNFYKLPFEWNKLEEILKEIEPKRLFKNRLKLLNLSPSWTNYWEKMNCILPCIIALKQHFMLSFFTRHVQLAQSFCVIKFPKSEPRQCAPIVVYLFLYCSYVHTLIILYCICIFLKKDKIRLNVKISKIDNATLNFVDFNYNC